MKESFLLRLPRGLKTFLEEEAKARGLTLTGLINALLSEYKEQKER